MAMKLFLSKMKDPLRVIKILSIEELQSQSISAEEMMKIINNSHEEEIELENK